MLLASGKFRSALLKTSGWLTSTTRSYPVLIISVARPGGPVKHMGCHWGSTWLPWCICALWSRVRGPISRTGAQGTEAGIVSQRGEHNKCGSDQITRWSSELSWLVARQLGRGQSAPWARIKDTSGFVLVPFWSSILHTQRHIGAKDGPGPLRTQIQGESVSPPKAPRPSKPTCSVSQYQPFIFQSRDFASHLHLQLDTGQHLGTY